MPECESLGSARYDQDWVKDVLPGSISESSGNFVPEVCLKYLPKNDTGDWQANETCASDWFETNTEKCNRWVFDEGERTIVNDVSSTFDL